MSMSIVAAILVRSKRYAMRKLAYRMLIERPSRLARSSLMRALRLHADNDAVLALARLADPAAIPVILSHLSYPFCDVDVAVQALNTISPTWMRDHRALQVLPEMLRSFLDADRIETEERSSRQARWHGVWRWRHGDWLGYKTAPKYDQIVDTESPRRQSVKDVIELIQPDWVDLPLAKSLVATINGRVSYCDCPVLLEVIGRSGDPDCSRLLLLAALHNSTNISGIAEGYIAKWFPQGLSGTIALELVPKLETVSHGPAAGNERMYDGPFINHARATAVIECIKKSVPIKFPMPTSMPYPRGTFESSPVYTDDIGMAIARRHLGEGGTLS